MLVRSQGRLADFYQCFLGNLLPRIVRSVHRTAESLIDLLRRLGLSCIYVLLDAFEPLAPLESLTETELLRNALAYVFLSLMGGL